MNRRDPGLLQLKHGAMLIVTLIFAITAAPVYENEQTAIESYDGVDDGCYYNYNHYGEGDRIITNEPCLNCTCHNRMLMCYLRVCPFTKPIGEDCIVEKREDQCCPVITCPEVPVELVDNSSSSIQSTELAMPDNYGCSINSKFYAEGAQVPSNKNKPCELCYCIRNMTACVMQECTLHIDGCQPIYNKGVCCPVRYSCDHTSDSFSMIDDHSATTIRPTEGFVLSTPKTESQQCTYNNRTFSDGALISTGDPCKHCYCMKGDIVCAVPECGSPLEHEAKNCVAQVPKTGQCCPDTFICDGSETVTIQPDDDSQDLQQHIIPQKTHVKGGTDTKRPIEKPKDPKVDKSSEEDDEDTTISIHATTESSATEIIKPHDQSGEDNAEEKETTAAEKVTKAPSILIEMETEAPSISVKETTLAPKDSDEKETEAPETSDEIQTTQRAVETPSIDQRVSEEGPASTQAPSEEQKPTEKLDEDETTVETRIKDNQESEDELTTKAAEKVSTTNFDMTETSDLSEHVTTLKSVDTDAEDEESSGDIQSTEAPHHAEDHTDAQKAENEEVPSNFDATEKEKTDKTAVAVDLTTLKTDILEDNTSVSVDLEETTKVYDSQEPLMGKGDGVKGSGESEESTEDKVSVTEATLIGSEKQTDKSSDIETATTQFLPTSDKNDITDTSDLSVGEELTTLKSILEASEVSKEEETESTALPPVKPTTVKSISSDEDSDDETIRKVTEIPSRIDEIEEEKTDKPAIEEDQTTLKSDIPEDHTSISVDHEETTMVSESQESLMGKGDGIKGSGESGESTEDKVPETPVDTEKETEKQNEVDVPTTKSSLISDGKDDTTLATNELERETTLKSIADTETKIEDEVTTPASEIPKVIEQVGTSELPSEISTEEQDEDKATTPRVEEKEASTQKAESDFAEVPSKEIVTEMPEIPDNSTPESITIPQHPMESDSHKVDEMTIEPEIEDEKTTVKSIMTKESDDMNTLIPERVTEQPEKSYIPPTTIQPDGEKIDVATDEPFDELPPKIPGETDCLFNGITFSNNSPIPTADEECLESCVCFNSIVRCKSSCDLDSTDVTARPNEDEEDTTAVVVEVTKPSVEIPAIVKEIYPSTSSPIAVEDITEDNEIDETTNKSKRPILKVPHRPSTDEESETTNKIDLDESATEKPETSETTTEKHVQVISTEHNLVELDTDLTTISSAVSKIEGESTDAPTEKQTESKTDRAYPDMPEDDFVTSKPLDTDSLMKPSDEEESSTDTPRQKPGSLDDRLGSGEDEDVLTTKKTTIVEDEDALATKKPTIAEDEDDLATKEPTIVEDEDALATKKPTIAEDEDVLATKKPTTATKVPLEDVTLSTDLATEKQDQDEDQTEKSISETTTAKDLKLPEYSEKLTTLKPKYGDSQEEDITMKTPLDSDEDFDVHKQHKTTIIPTLEDDETTAQPQKDFDSDDAITTMKPPAHQDEVDQEKQYTMKPNVTVQESEEMTTEKPDKTQEKDEQSTVKSAIEIDESKSVDTTRKPFEEQTEKQIDAEIAEHTESGEATTIRSGSHLVDENKGEKDVAIVTENPNASEEESKTLTVLPESYITEINDVEQATGVPVVKGQSDDEIKLEATTVQFDVKRPSESSTESIKSGESDDQMTESPIHRPDIYDPSKHDENVVESTEKTPANKEETITTPDDKLSAGDVTEQPDFVHSVDEDANDTTSKPVENEDTETSKPVKGDEAYNERPEDDEVVTSNILEEEETTTLKTAGKDKTSTTSAYVIDEIATNKPSDSNEVQTSKPTESNDDKTSRPAGDGEVDTSKPPHMTEASTTEPEDSVDVKTSRPFDEEEVVTSKTVESEEVPAVEGEGIATTKPKEEVSHTQNPSEQEDGKTSRPIDIGEAHTNQPVEENEVTTSSSVESTDDKISTTKTEVIDEIATNKPSDLEEVQTSKPADRDDTKTTRPVTDEEAVTNKPIEEEVSQTQGPSEQEEDQTRRPIDNEEDHTNKQVDKDEVTTSKTVEIEDGTTNKPGDSDYIETTKPVQYEKVATIRPDDEKDTVTKESISEDEIATSVSFDSKTTRPAESETTKSTDSEEVVTSKFSETEEKITSKPTEDEEIVTSKSVESEEVSNSTSVQSEDQTSSPVEEEKLTTSKQKEGEDVSTLAPGVSLGDRIDVDQTANPEDEKTQRPFESEEDTQKPIDHPVQIPHKVSEDDSQKPVDHDDKVPQHPVEEPFTTDSPVKQPDTGLASGYPTYDEDYTEEDEDPAQFGPGTCRYGGKLYVSAQQIPRDDPCDFCFCFRSDIICLQQSCPPPIQGCHEEPISGFCCPRYECHVGMATVMNITTSTTTTTTTLPPHFVHNYKGAARKSGCQIQGKAYGVGEEVVQSSGPCMRCVCGGDANMKCEPKACSPAPMLQQMIAVAAQQRRR